MVVVVKTIRTKSRMLPCQKWEGGGDAERFMGTQSVWKDEANLERTHHRHCLMLPSGILQNGTFYVFFKIARSGLYVFCHINLLSLLVKMCCSCV